MGSAGQVPDHCHSEERNDEESRSRQGEQFDSKNEMLHFVQHDKSLNNVIPLPFHGWLERTVMSEGSSLACHCEKPVRATPVLSEAPGFVGGEVEGSQSPNKKGGDCFASLTMASRGHIWFQRWS